MTSTLPLTLVGAGGLLAGEALRLLEQHPRLELRHAVTRSPGALLRELHPHLAGAALAQCKTTDLATATRDLSAHLVDPEAKAVVLMGLPHGQSAQTWRGLRKELGGAAERVVLVDLSADYRLGDPEAYARWYGQHPDLEELPHFRYGLPELATETLQGAMRIAAPGCFATALQFACLPAAQAGLLRDDQTWTLSAITGSSGAGAKPKDSTHHPFRASNLWAYAMGGHRHEAELEQALGHRPPLAFVPHCGPFVRGIHLTAVLPLRDDLDLEGVRGLYRERFRASAFVEVLEGDAVPELRRVVGSNRVSLALHSSGNSLVVLVALDNILKGGSGQALQALNLALCWPETLGLPSSAFGVS